MPAVVEESRSRFSDSMESDIHGRDEVSIEDDGTAVPSPHSAQDALFGEWSDLCRRQSTMRGTAQDDSHSSVVGELDQVSDVADEDDRLSEEGGPDPVESEVEEQPQGVASLRTGFTFVETGESFGSVPGRRLCDEERTAILCAVHTESQ